MVSRRLWSVMMISMAAGNPPWAIHNSGDPQKILVDHYTFESIPGVVGEDIHLPPPTQKGRPVTVAVLDTGVDVSHPALKNRLLLPGFNAITGTDQIEDTHGHGTHIAGIIGGRPDSNSFRGVSDWARILPIKVVQTGPNAPIRPQGLEAGTGTALTETVARGMEVAMDRGAEIIHLSLAWPAFISSRAYDHALARAKKMRVLVVASAGNDHTLADVHPCSDESVICVGSHGPDGAPSHFSNHGPMVDLLAPGLSILSSWPLKKNPVSLPGAVGYELRNGTSMAAPFVTGALAELIARGFSPEEASSRILAGSRPTRDLKEDDDFRFGNLDLSRALEISPEPLILPKEKGVRTLEWDGHSPTLEFTVEWINLWEPAQDVRISGPSHHDIFKSIPSRGIVETRVSLKIDPSGDSDRLLSFDVQSGRSQNPPRKVSVPIRVIQRIHPNAWPTHAEVRDLLPPSGFEGCEIRSLRGDPKPSSDGLVFIKNRPNGLDVAVLQEGQTQAIFRIPEAEESRFLGLYRSPDQSLMLLIQEPSRLDQRTGTLVYRISSTGKTMNSLRIDPTITQIPEDFSWIPGVGGFNPAWVSLGAVPEKDRPPEDPWAPKAKEQRLPHLYTLKGNELRMIPLPEGFTPFLLLPHSSLIATFGPGYEKRSFKVPIQDGVAGVPEAQTKGPPRMFLGGSVSIPLSLEAQSSSMRAVSTPSGLGGLRVSGVSGSGIEWDRILDRPGRFDSLISLLGVIPQGRSASLYAESHFDILFYPESGTDSNRGPLVTSLHRFSYVPSMIFRRGFFATVLSGTNNIDALYVPASLANGEVSEIIRPDPKKSRLIRPIAYRYATDPGCVAIGNLIDARRESPAKLRFICGTREIRIPLTSGE